MFFRTHAARCGVVVNVMRGAKELTQLYRSAKPATREVLKNFTEHTGQDIMDVLATADKASLSWSTRPIEVGGKIISHAAQLSGPTDTGCSD
jgi:acyl-CoA reductase-like NAD-dependent aldehyde dehydrogenase